MESKLGGFVLNGHLQDSGLHKFLQGWRVRASSFSDAKSEIEKE